jgi:hypothetical protein
MRYFQYEDDNDFIGKGIRYIETDEGYTIREVTVCGNCFLGSNFYYPHDGLMLSEGKCEYETIAEVIEITKETFDTTWAAHLAQNMGRWSVIKHSYPVGFQVQGRIAVFYPQGVIVDLGDGGTLGIANYEACKSSTQSKFMYPNHRIHAIVQGYDDLNQWLILEFPQVHEEIVNSPYWWI